MITVRIDKKMREHAEVEAARREPYIKHLFTTEHADTNQTNSIGFLGEFAMCTLMGIDYTENIREDYLKPDSGDLMIGDLVVDVKTETIPQSHLGLIISGWGSDDRMYGRRLIAEDQIKNLYKYDVVVFGVMPRETLEYWSCFGYIYTKDITKYNPSAVIDRPDGGKYPYPCLPIKTSKLRSVQELINDEHRR